MLVLLALSAGFGKFPEEVAPELELPGRMTYSFSGCGWDTCGCDPFQSGWRYAHVSGAEMKLAGVDYGQKVTRVQCFDACGSDPACAQAVCYSKGESVWEADAPCFCYPTSRAIKLDSDGKSIRALDSDGKGGSNTGFASIHCNDGRTPTCPTCPTCPTPTKGMYVEGGYLKCSCQSCQHGWKCRY